MRCVLRTRHRFAFWSYIYNEMDIVNALWWKYLRFCALFCAPDSDITWVTRCLKSPATPRFFATHWSTETRFNVITSPLGLCVFDKAKFCWADNVKTQQIQDKMGREVLPSSLDPSWTYSIDSLRTPWPPFPFCKYLVGRCCTPIRLRIARLESIALSTGH